MRKQAERNKAAWEYRAYEFWHSRGTLAEIAACIKKDPKARLRYHQNYFADIKGLKIANPCGSNGRIAVPLALLGAEVTVFDVSEENKKYAMELAKQADVQINYIVDDFCEAVQGQYQGFFDIVYAEGGILHYFSELDLFTKKLFQIKKVEGASS